MHKYICLWCGAFIGAIARYEISNINITRYYGVLSLNTLIINLSGVFFMAFIMTLIVKALPINSNIQLGIITGFMGAFTTFSTMCKEASTLMMNDHYQAAIIYLLSSALLGLAIAYLGTRLAQYVSHKILLRRASNTLT